MLTTAAAPVATPGDQNSPGDSANRDVFQGFSWRNMLLAIILLGLMLMLPAWLMNKISFRPYPALANRAIVQVILPDPADPYDFLAGLPPDDRAGWPTRLKLEVDGQVLFEKSYDPTNLFSNAEDSLFEELQIAPGEHLVCLCFEGEKNKSLILAVRKETFTPGQILSLGFDDSGPPPQAKQKK
jgi:hypothetical protein